MKKYNEFILEKYITIDYKIVLKDDKYNPITYITDFRIVKTENGKSEVKAKGFQKEKGGWKSFDDEKDNKTRTVWHKYIQNGNKKIKILD